jgi:hypothetical protein
MVFEVVRVVRNSVQPWRTTLTTAFADNNFKGFHGFRGCQGCWEFRSALAYNIDKCFSRQQFQRFSRLSFVTQSLISLSPISYLFISLSLITAHQKQIASSALAPPRNDVESSGNS